MSVLLQCVANNATWLIDSPPGEIAAAVHKLCSVSTVTMRQANLLCASAGRMQHNAGGVNTLCNYLSTYLVAEKTFSEAKLYLILRTPDMTHGVPITYAVTSDYRVYVYVDGGAGGVSDSNRRPLTFRASAAVVVVMLDDGLEPLFLVLPAGTAQTGSGSRFCWVEFAKDNFRTPLDYIRQMR